MAVKIQAIRGMRDILPGQTDRWQWLESRIRAHLDSYAYQEIRMPVLEKTDLFKRSIGEVTDIVEKEMYTFQDRNGDSLTLRPEGTASCVRACLENGLLHNQMQRLWYQGPMFRHERPQKGRYRQFHQVGVEAFGMPGPDVDIELILMTASLWRALGLKGLRLELNSLGTPDERREYRVRLVDYFTEHKDKLDQESLQRLTSNPLRILDSKNPDLRELILAAPTLMDDLSLESKGHFHQVCTALDEAGIGYEVNSLLVRGLDYYSRTVFEWITDDLGAQGTVCAGGRYDGLVEQLGGKPTPAVGFAMGLERLLEVLEVQQGYTEAANADVYLILVGDAASRRGLLLADALRAELPTLRVASNCGAGSFKSQFKRADKSGARVAVIVGEDELQSGQAQVKPLRGGGDQVSVPLDSLVDRLGGIMKAGMP